MNEPFVQFPKIPRFSRDIIITEKIDGTNGQLYIYQTPEGEVPAEGMFCDLGCTMLVGSRNRWLTKKSDNFGFCNWAMNNGTQLISLLGPGRHYGEWWGAGIQRGYGLKEKRFSLFNVSRWDALGMASASGGLCHVVPVLYRGMIFEDSIYHTLDRLRVFGSVAAPGFMDPEGIIIYHIAGDYLFKKTLKNDEGGKGNA